MHCGRHKYGTTILFGYKMEGGGGGFLKNNPKNLCLFCIAALDSEVFWKGKPHLSRITRNWFRYLGHSTGCLIAKKYSNLQEPQ